VVKAHFGTISKDGSTEVGKGAVESELGVKDGALIGGAGGMGVEDADGMTEEGARGFADTGFRGSFSKFACAEISFHTMLVHSFFTPSFLGASLHRAYQPNLASGVWRGARFFRVARRCARTSWWTIFSHNTLPRLWPLLRSGPSTELR
jgi:hypothetical protein